MGRVRGWVEKRKIVENRRSGVWWCGGKGFVANKKLLLMSLKLKIRVILALAGVARCYYWECINIMMHPLIPFPPPPPPPTVVVAAVTIAFPSSPSIMIFVICSTF